jgi:RecJ-like exonuclease
MGTSTSGEFCAFCGGGVNERIFVDKGMLVATNDGPAVRLFAKMVPVCTDHQGEGHTRGVSWCSSCDQWVAAAGCPHCGNSELIFGPNLEGSPEQ